MVKAAVTAWLLRQHAQASHPTPNPGRGWPFTFTFLNTLLNILHFYKKALKKTKTTNRGDAARKASPIARFVHTHHSLTHTAVAGFSFLRLSFLSLSYKERTQHKR